MKRIITAMLTLALFTSLSAEKASAQQAKDQQSIWNDITFNEHATSDLEGLIAIIALAATETGIIDPSDCPQVIDPDLRRSHSFGYRCGDGSDAVLAGGTLYVSDYNGNRILGFNGLPTHDEDSIVLDGSGGAEGIIDPSDCPELVDLWFELVDAGYTEDEAFEMIEVVMEGTFEDGICSTMGASGLTSYEGKLPIAEPLPESLHHTFVDYINELVDAGYTEDEAFEMIEMVMDEGLVGRSNLDRLFTCSGEYEAIWIVW